MSKRGNRIHEQISVNSVDQVRRHMNLQVNQGRILRNDVSISLVPRLHHCAHCLYCQTPT